MAIKFFKIQNTNIRVNNIKQYGISKVPKTKYDSFALSLLFELIAPEEEYCMYITTYQNDNFKFYGSKEYVENKMFELENLMKSN